MPMHAYTRSGGGGGVDPKGTDDPYIRVSSRGQLRLHLIRGQVSEPVLTYLLTYLLT